jgi:hypothetical protein
MDDVVALFPGLDKILIYIVGSSDTIHVEAPATSQLFVATPLGVRRGLSVAFLCESYISIF